MSNGNLITIFGKPFQPENERRVDPPEIQLQDAILAAGMDAPDHIVLDGKIHRFNSGGKRDKSAWYIAFGDGVPAGRFGDWREGIEVKWHADVGRELSPAEQMAHARRMAEASAAREAELKKSREVVADTVAKIWIDAGAASQDHPYLARKGIQPNGARITGDGRLIVPLYNRDGKLVSLQYISDDGTKRYHPGGPTGGSFWGIGTTDEPGPVYLAEGFATASTIHEATGRCCFIAYSASNLISVAETIRTMHDDLIIVADNDKSGIGKRYAEQAAAKYGAKVIVPPIEGDANDYAMAGHDLMTLLAPSSGQAVLDRLQLVFGDQLGDEYEAPDELVEGLMTAGSSVVVYGDSNSGKTFWALSVATAIATGSDCYGCKTDPGLVVYLASEAPASIRTRMQAIKKFHDCDLRNLAIVPVPLNFHSGDQDAHDIIEAVKAIEQSRGQPVRLIIGDTLARMSAGANENSGEDMGPVMARFDQVANATGAAMMIIHHIGKDAARGARGWSGIRAHIDTEIEVVEKDGVRSATVTKQRELPSKGSAIYFKLEVVEMGAAKFGGIATTCVAIPNTDAGAAEPHKKPTKHDENLRTLERAWWHTGAEERDGVPYLSRSGLQDFLVGEGYARRTAANKVDPSRSNGLIMPMLNAEVMERYEHGWIFKDSVQISTMLMRKSAKK